MQKLNHPDVEIRFADLEFPPLTAEILDVEYDLDKEVVIIE